jgi:transposase
MIGAMARHRVQVLREGGKTLRRIASETGISLRSVNRIVRESPIESLGQAASAKAHGVGRPSKVEPYRERIAGVLASEPKLPTVEILHRMRGLGYDGAKSALYEMVRALRPRPVTPLVRFEGLPGEFSQHDFGHVEVRYLDGTEERVHFFASRLKYSRCVEVGLVENERIEALVRSLLAAFSRFEGVPLVAVFDNPKTITRGREGGRILRNETFGQVALDYGFGIELCTPGRAQEKGSVENLVGFVKGSFFKVRRLHDRPDMVAQLADWHHEVNDVRPCRATGVPPAARLAADRARLRPLVIAPEDYALRFPVMVGPTGVVRFEGYEYSMDPEAIGIPGTLWLYRDRVRIVAGRHVSEHARVPECGRTRFHPEHRTARLAKVAGERGRLYLKRQELLELGPVAETFLTEIVHRHRFTWKAEVEELHGALLAHGPAAVQRSLAAAATQRLYAARHVLDLLPQEVR